MRVVSRSIDLQRLGHDRQQPLHLGVIAVFIQADAEPFRRLHRSAIGQTAQVEPLPQRQAMNLRSLRADHINAVEATAIGQAQSQGRQALLELRAQHHQSPGDPRQPLRTVMDGIEGRHHCQQHLRRADVAGGLVTADVLLAGLQRQPQGRTPFSVAGLTDDATWQLAPIALTGCEKGGVGTTATHRYTETLGAAHGDVSPEAAHRFQQHLSQGVNGHGDQRTLFMGLRDASARIPEASAAPRQLQQHPEHIRSPLELIWVSHLELHPDGLSPGAQHRQGLWQHRGIHQKTLGFGALAHPEAHGHRFGGSGGFIQQRGIGDRQPGELADQRLEIEQGLQPALGNLRLIRGVGGVPSRVLQHLTLDQSGGDRAVIPQADQGAHHAVGLGELLQFRQRLGFIGAGGKHLLRGLGIQDVLRHHSPHKRLEIGKAELGEHGLNRRIARPDVALNKRRKMVLGLRLHHALFQQSHGAQASRVIVGNPTERSLQV